MSKGRPFTLLMQFNRVILCAIECPRALPLMAAALLVTKYASWQQQQQQQQRWQQQWQRSTALHSVHTCTHTITPYALTHKSRPLLLRTQQRQHRNCVRASERGARPISRGNRFSRLFSAPTLRSHSSLRPFSYTQNKDVRTQRSPL